MAEPTDLLIVDRLLERRRTADARKRLAALLSAQPGDVEVLLRLARADHLDDDEDSALEHVESALARDPGHQDARYLLASIQCAQKNYVDAEATLIDLLRENPRDADYMASYARVMLLSLEIEKAERLVQEAIRLDPENAEALFVGTLVANVQGRSADMHASLGELLAENPDNQQVASLLFYVLVSNRKFKEAERIGQQLLRHDPSNERIVDALVDLRVTNHWAAWPLYPFIRWGWAGSAGMWVLAVVGGRVLLRHDPALGLTFLLCYLAIVIYSWTYEPLFKRWVRARGLA